MNIASEDVIGDAPSRASLQRDRPAYSPSGWDNGAFDVQAWLDRAPWGTLRKTEYGCVPGLEPHPAVWDDPLINEIYKLDIATFLTAEEVSVQGISRLVSLAPDEGSCVFLATQTVDEARHFEVFCRRLADFGVSPEQRRGLVARVTTRQMRAFYDVIREQVDKGDFIGALVAHNIILEGMAYPVYRYEIKYWSRLDPALSRIIQGAFADEVHHVTFGEAYIRDFVAKSPEARNRVTALAHDCRRLLTEVFEAVIHKYIGLYQEAANAHMDLMGDIQIFSGTRMADVSEEEQVRRLLAEIQFEYEKRLRLIGISQS